MDIISRVREQYPQLSKTQKRVADHILNNTDTACFQTLKDWSRLTGVSESTIISFCAKFPCESFLGMKRELQSYIKGWVSPSEKIKRSTSRLNLSLETLQKLQELEMQNLTTTFEFLNQEQLTRFVHELKEAEEIHVVGHGISASIAMMLQSRLQQTGVRAHDLMNILDYRETVYEVANAGKDDLFVVISFPNYAPQTIALVNYLRSIDAKMVCITDKASSPIAQSARAVLLCSTEDMIFYNSMTSVIAMINIICSALVLENKDRFLTRASELEAIEKSILQFQDRHASRQSPGTRNRFLNHEKPY